MLVFWGFFFLLTLIIKLILGGAVYKRDDKYLNSTRSQNLWEVKNLKERKTFISHVRLDETRFENEASFLSLTTIVITRDFGDYTDFHVLNRMMEAVEILFDEFVDIVVPHGANLSVNLSGKTSVFYRRTAYNIHCKRCVLEYIIALQSHIFATKVLPNPPVKFLFGSIKRGYIAIKTPHKLLKG